MLLAVDDGVKVIVGVREGVNVVVDVCAGTAKLQDTRKNSNTVVFNLYFFILLLRQPNTRMERIV